MLIVPTVASCFGCGSSEPERVKVSGNVTYMGKPIAQGSIRFIPTGDTKGPTASANIQQGKYEAVAKGGVVVGINRVEITAIAPRKDPMGRDLAAMEGAGVQYMPIKYNHQSELTVKIESGGPDEHDFNLK